MKTFIGLVLWCFLFIVCWPLALVALILFPFIWLLLLPFRILGFTITLTLSMIGAIFMLPFAIAKAF